LQQTTAKLLWCNVARSGKVVKKRRPTELIFDYFHCMLTKAMILHLSVSRYLFLSVINVAEKADIFATVG